MKQNETNLGEKREKGETTFYCICCDYKCCVKFSYDRHLTTSKHINKSQMKQNGTNKEKKEKKEKKENNACNCGVVYYSRTSLWRHKQKCKLKEDYEEEEKTSDEIYELKEIMKYLMKENSEMKNMIMTQHISTQNIMIDVIKTGTHNTTNNTNSHNKAFNLNFFLNETCKNAMNITDFVDSIKLQLSDLMEVGELGYVEGISKIIVKNLNNLDETIRPVHCTDKKRETMYIKDEGEWNKEDEKKSKLKKVITRVANKNIRLLPEFREKYPDYGNSSSKTSDIYHKMIVEAMETDDDKKEKIIKNISKVTTIKE
jgi:hypothetical protein